MGTDGGSGGIAAATGRRRPGGPAKGDRRRQAILEAVEEQLRERSIAQLSVEGVAAAAGISRSGFYFYFESKYAALAEALSEVAEEMTQASQRFFGGSDEPPEQVVPEALWGVADLWRRHVALMCAIVDASHSDDGARAVWEAWTQGFATAIAERIRVERAAGRAPDGPPADHLARVLLHTNLATFYEDGRRGAAHEESRHSVDALAHLWLSAIWGIARPV